LVEMGAESKVFFFRWPGVHPKSGVSTRSLYVALLLCNSCTSSKRGQTRMRTIDTGARRGKQGWEGGGAHAGLEPRWCRMAWNRTRGSLLFETFKSGPAYPGNRPSERGLVVRKRQVTVVGRNEGPSGERHPARSGFGGGGGRAGVGPVSKRIPVLGHGDAPSQNVWLEEVGSSHACIGRPVNYVVWCRGWMGRNGNEDVLCVRAGFAILETALPRGREEDVETPT